MTDQKIIRYIDQMCVKDGDIEVKNICKDGSYTLVVPVINGGLEFNAKQIATLEMESYFDGEEMVLLNFPKNLLSSEDYIYITEILEEALLYRDDLENVPSTSDNREPALDDRSPELDALEEIRAVAEKIREEMISLYGDDLAGECIEASEKIVQALSDTLGIKAKTVEGWCRYDDEYYGSDRPWDPHTWVEIESLQIYIDVTADQFNYGMTCENEFQPVIVRKGLPHGMQYEEPSWDDYELEVDESVMTLLASIAETHIPGLKGRSDLESVNNDSDDFFPSSVWNLKSALVAAYQFGREGVLTRTAERISHEPLPDPKEEHRIIRKVIGAMVAYGLDSCWNDSDVIDTLVDIGITKEDFENAGYGQFIKAYFEEEPDRPEEKQEGPMTAAISLSREECREMEEATGIRIRSGDDLETAVRMAIEKYLGHEESVPVGSKDSLDTVIRSVARRAAEAQCAADKMTKPHENEM